MWCTCFGLLPVLLLLVGVTEANPTSARINPRTPNAGTHFRIIHTNDMHSRFEQTSQLSGECSRSDAGSNKCYGGFARLATLIRKARAESTPVLFLNAGDTYQGTIWFTAYQWKIVAKFLNILNPDAISLGNHEFDTGVDGLLPFLNNVTFPVLAANLDLKNEPKLAATKLAKSAILNVNGARVGVIGYLTPETKYIATTGNVIFEDEVEAISKEAKRLKNNGVNILIALGHSGYETDKIIAAEVEDIDLVIGAHTNTFLYNGTQPDSETPTGLYPTAITQSNGRRAYVVQAYAYTKYFGNLYVTFDSDGELTHIAGNPILVDSTIEQAVDVLEELEKWREQISKIISTAVGSTRVHLDGERESCRREECNLGNLVTDGLVDYNMRQYTGSNGWTDAAIAVINSGALKTSISATNNNQITMGDILAVFPFGNSVVIVSMTGRKLLQMLEWSVYYLIENPTEELKGIFLQHSGIQVTYDLSKPANSKVVSVQLRCAKCSVPMYSKLNLTETYSVITTDYLYGGGDNYTMIPELEYKTIDASLSDIVIDYLGKHSPVYPVVGGRITFSNTADATDDTANGASYITHSMTMIILPLMVRILT